MGRYVLKTVGESPFGETNLVKVFDSLECLNDYLDKTDYQWEAYFYCLEEEYLKNKKGIDKQINI